MEICFATHNKNKVREIANKLGPSFLVKDLWDLGIPEIEETGKTLEDNSLIKAEYVYLNHGFTVFSDDSGLEVDALGGAPGVFSARYAGEPKDDVRNLKLLLKNMSDISDRKARFKTVITFISDRETIQFKGTIEGKIALEPAGDSGFGYDPVFVPEGHSRTFAQMSLEEKNQMSHRARATEKLLTYLRLHYAK